MEGELHKKVHKSRKCKLNNCNMLNQHDTLNVTHMKNPDVHINLFVTDHTSLYI